MRLVSIYFNARLVILLLSQNDLDLNRVRIMCSIREGVRILHSYFSSVSIKGITQSDKLLNNELSFNFVCVVFEKIRTVPKYEI